MVDLIVLNYNDANTTIDFIDTIKEYPSIKNIIIVDNCSTDISFSMLLKLKNDRIHVIQTDRNGGYGSGNNFGIRYLQNIDHSNYVLQCNPDVYIDNDTIVNMEAFLSSNSEYALVAPVMHNSTGVPQKDTAFKINNCLTYILSFEMILSKLFRIGLYNDLLDNSSCHFDVDAVAGSLFMFDFDVMVNHGMFDERVFLYCEERILGMKFADAGYKTAVLLKEKFVHNHSVTINKVYNSSLKTRKLLNQSRQFVVKEYYHASRFVQLLCKLLCQLSLLELFIRVKQKEIKHKLG